LKLSEQINELLDRHPELTPMGIARELDANYVSVKSAIYHMPPAQKQLYRNRMVRHEARRAAERKKENYRLTRGRASMWGIDIILYQDETGKYIVEKFNYDTI